MRVIIAGGRDVTNFALVEQAMAQAALQGIVPTVVVSGGARGVDTLGQRWARQRGIPVDRYPVTPGEWKSLGPKAGPLRNRRMADNAEALVAIPGPKSRGTWDMIGVAKERGMPYIIYEGASDGRDK